MSSTASNHFVGAVQRNARSKPNKTALTFLNDKCQEIQWFTYAELWLYSHNLAHQLLHQYHLKKGDRACIVYTPGLDFIIALLACFRLGVIVVSVYPPNPARLEEDVPKFSRFIEDSGTRIALTTKAFKRIVGISTKLKSKVHWPEGLEWLATDSYDRNDANRCPNYEGQDDVGRTAVNCAIVDVWPTLEDGDLLFIQYTSGN